MCPEQSILLALYLCAMAAALRTDWRALAVAILLPAALVTAGESQGLRLRCSAGVRAGRLEAWGVDRERIPFVH
jgi:hypothetical protein